jgi:glutamine---fructose-6-phosphate transaminase (isomerizing)
MCGIFGYVGSKKNTAEIVFDGLKLLEYRGYDSWGIAVKSGKTITVEKHTGKIGDAKIGLPESSLGIGHTRWATHGGVTTANAHPHLDCNKEVAVLHNGIIENYAEIKEELLKRGHTFLSETDTEVVPHLIEENLASHGFATSFRMAFNRLHGLNAIVALYAPSKEIIAAKTGSPLVVGTAPDGQYIASDISGIIKHTRNVYFLKDNEMVIMGKDVQLVTLPEGKQIVADFQTIDWKFEEVDKGKYDHFMIKEIHEQPTIIRNIAQNYDDQLRQLAQEIIKARGTYFIGAGTASYACLAGTYLFSKIAHRHVNTAFASEFNYLEDFLTEKSLVIALSQSGETIDVIEPLQRAKQKGSKIIALVNALGSTIYRMSDQKLLLGAGPEKAVASTKVFVAKLALLLLLAYTIAGKQDEGQQLLLQSADEIERLLSPDEDKRLSDVADVLVKSEHIYVIGRGLSYAIALEAALKIKEVSYIHTEGLAGGELKHGPIALITPGTPCIIFAPKDETRDAILSNAMEVKSRGGIIIGISSENSTVFDHWIPVADAKEATMLSEVVPAQVIAYKIALRKKLDPDKPRNLAKSVTVK